MPRGTNTSQEEVAFSLTESHVWDHRPQHIKITRMTFYYIAFLARYSFIGSFLKYFDHFKPVSGENQDSLQTLKKAI